MLNEHQWPSSARSPHRAGLFSFEASSLNYRPEHREPCPRPRPLFAKALQIVFEAAEAEKNKKEDEKAHSLERLSMRTDSDLTPFFGKGRVWDDEFTVLNRELQPNQYL